MVQKQQKQTKAKQTSEQTDIQTKCLTVDLRFKFVPFFVNSAF